MYLHPEELLPEIVANRADEHTPGEGGIILLAGEISQISLEKGGGDLLKHVKLCSGVACLFGCFDVLPVDVSNQP